MVTNVTLKESVAMLEEEIKKAEEKTSKRRELIGLLDKNQDVLNEKENKLLLATLQKLVEENGKDFELMKLQIKHLYRLRNMNQLAFVADATHKAFPDKVYPLEWLCKVYLEFCTQALDFDEHPVMEEAASFTEKLLNLNPKSNLGNLCKGAVYFSANQIEDCITFLTPLVNRVGTNPNFYAHLVLSFALIKKSLFARAEKMIRKSLSLLSKVKEADVRLKKKHELNGLLLQAIYNQFSFQENEEALKEVLEECKDANNVELLTKTKVRLGLDINEEEANSHLNDMAKVLISVLRLQKNAEYKEALAMLENYFAASKQDPDFESLITFGELKVALGDSTNAMSYFLKAAKLNSAHFLPFAYLGIIYEGRKDFDKAKKCLLKSIELNPNSGLAGTALAGLLTEQGEMTSLLQTVLSENPNCHWANIQMSLINLDENDTTKAISAVQRALRTRPLDIKAWLVLAQAYKCRGSFTAALKAYHRILELSQGQNVFAHLQVGLIHKDLRQLDEALLFLKDTDKCNEQEALQVPWFNGLAETLLYKLQESLQIGLEDNAIDFGVRSVDVLSKSLIIDAKVSHTWSLLARTLTSLHTLSDTQLSRFEVPNSLKISIGKTFKPRVEELLLIACTCLKRAITLHPTSLGLWRDLGKSFYLVSECKKNDERKEWLQKASKALKNALSIEDKCHLTWNYMGLVSMALDKLAFAQHAFIRSIECEANASAWTNLGVLYFTLGDQGLANSAFCKAQSLSPDSLRCWLGQAMLAELQNYDEEAMDLFRHCNSLGNHPQASLGYAFWVCKTLKKLDNNEDVSAHSKYSLERMHGVTVALDALIRIKHFADSDDALCARNYEAFLLTRQNRLQTASCTLRQCVDTFFQDADNECDNAEGEDRRNKILVNLGLLLARGDDFEGSLALLCDERLGSGSFYRGTALALTYFNLGRYEESYKCYETCLRTERHMSDILTAMACIAYRFQGANAAKTLLFQGCQRQPVSVAGVFALAVLGHQEGNNELISAALQLLKQHQNDSKWRVDVARLNAAVLSNGKSVEAKEKKAVIDSKGKRVLGEILHLFPQDAGLWLAMEPFLSPSVALKMAIKVLSLGKHDPELCQKACKIVMRHRWNNREKNEEDSSFFKEAVASVHERPHDALAWIWLALECKISGKNKLAQKLALRVSEMNEGGDQSLAKLLLS